MISVRTGVEYRGYQITSTVARRFSLVALVAASIFSGPKLIPQSVNKRPGETELTRILGEQMTASDLDRWMAALLETAYGSEEPEGLMPATEAVVMKDPSLFSSSSLAACMSHRWDLTL